MTPACSTLTLLGAEAELEGVARAELEEVMLELELVRLLLELALALLFSSSYVSFHRVRLFAPGWNSFTWLVREKEIRLFFFFTSSFFATFGLMS